MEQSWIRSPDAMERAPGRAKRDTTAEAAMTTMQQDDMRIAEHMSAAAAGDAGACFELGVAYSTGSFVAASDLVEAHKWFNLAALAGHDEAKTCRAEIAEEMTARDIAEAQRRAREWLNAAARKAA